MREARIRLRKRADGRWHTALPKGSMRIDTAREWVAVVLGLPYEAVKLVHADGRGARAEKRLGALREEWGSAYSTTTGVTLEQ
jgi:hypothetical protein